MSTKLFIRHPSFQTVESIKSITNARANQPPGSRFVEMPSPEAARKAIEMFNGKPFMKRSLAVSAAKLQSSHRPSGDRGGQRS